MRNSRIIQELRALAAEDEDGIKTKTALRLMLASHADLLEQMQDLQKNYMVAFGAFISSHPKLAGLLGFTLFVLSNVWFVSAFRRAALTLVGVPEDIVNILAP